MSRPELLTESLDHWRYIRQGLIAEVENIPADKFDFRPTPDVKSVHELVQHILEGSMMMAGELTRGEPNFQRMSLPEFFEEYSTRATMAQGKTKLVDLLTSQIEEGITRFKQVGEDALMGRVTNFDGSTMVANAVVLPRHDGGDVSSGPTRDLRATHGAGAGVDADDRSQWRVITRSQAGKETGCPPVVRYKSFRYQAKSWTTPRRIVAKVEHHRGELFPRVGFIVTNMTLPSRSVVRFYTKRGTAEQWIKEGKQATHWTRLSCHRFRANEVRLQLAVLAYNLGNLWRRLVLPPQVTRWSLTSLQQRLVDWGAADEACPVLLAPASRRASDRRLFGDMLRRIWALPVPAG